MSWIERLKKRWNVQTGWDVLIILIVFSCTGFTIVFIKHLFGVNSETHLLTRVLFYAFVLLLYQVILLGYGFIFGKYRFFLEFEKRMFRSIQKLFKRKKDVNQT